MPINYSVIAITPKANFMLSDLSKVEQAVDRALLGSVKAEAKAALNKRTTGWKVRPIMVASLFRRPAGAYGTLAVYPRGQGRDIWIWLTRGVGARTILPKRAKTLKVRFKYTPKTTPAGGFGGKGQYAGPTKRLRSVNWPGIPAREFEGKAKDEIEGIVIAMIHDAVERALR